MDNVFSGWSLWFLALALAFSAGAFAIWQTNIDNPIDIDNPIYAVQVYLTLSLRRKRR